MLGPHAPRRIFDVTLDLQLIEPLFRRKLSIERYALAFDCRKVFRVHAFHERELQLPPLFVPGAMAAIFFSLSPTHLLIKSEAVLEIKGMASCWHKCSVYTPA